MPTLETIERFVSRVEENKHDLAIEEFYAENASIQENGSEPRRGRDSLLENERKFLANASSIHSKCIRPVFLAGDKVVIRWQFRFEWRNGTVTEIEEIAYQKWTGEKILEEQFFYDPAQMAPR